MLNVPAGVATAVLAVVLIGAGILMAVAQNRANDVRDGALAEATALGNARVEAFNARAIEGTGLVNRGSGAQTEPAWEKAMDAAADSLGEAGVPDAESALGIYGERHAVLREADDAGDWNDAVAIAIGTSPARHVLGVGPVRARSTTSRADLGRSRRGSRERPGGCGRRAVRDRAPGVPGRDRRRRRRLGRRRPADGRVPMTAATATTAVGRARRRLGLAALTGAAALALSACAGTAGGSTTPAPTGSAAPTATPSPPAAVQCDNATQSYAPSRLPAPGKMPAGSTMREIQDRGSLVAGVSADTLLFGARNPLEAGGPIEGFDIDMLKQLSQAIFGRPDRVTYKVITAAQRIPSLEDGTVDVVARAMTINCERWTQIAFSAVYYQAGQKVLVASNSAARTIADLDGRRVCAPEGTTSLRRLGEYPGVVAVGAPTHTECLVRFQQGTVDAITGDDAILAGFAAQDPYAEVVGPAFSQEPYGLGINAENVDLVRFVNAVLERMRGDGSWQLAYDTWLRAPLDAGRQPVAVYGRPEGR